MRLLIAMITCLIIPTVYAQTIASPDVFTPVKLSSSNPNRLICVNGNVNDITFPQEIPVDGAPKGKNFFISYKIMDTHNGIEYVTKAHDFHVICGGEVFSLTAQPTPGIQGKIVWLGDPNKTHIDENAKMLREKSIEDLYVYLIMSAFHNNYMGNITVSEEHDQFPALVDGVGIELIREMVLNGAGIRLKEFVLSGVPGTNVQKELFLKKQLSNSILSIATYPATIGRDGKSRLFIVESKL